MKGLTVILIFTFSMFAAISCGGEAARNTTVVNANNANSTSASTSATTPLPAATIDELASGRRVYETNCRNCHKETGKGGPVEIEGRKIDPDDLTSEKIKGFSDEKILGYIMNGVEDEGMPAFKGRLSEAEMRDVVKFIRVELQGMPAKDTSPKR
ncbi:MAG TPA: cytochrome c [Pyrinomonadaceae bacterium]